MHGLDDDYECESSIARVVLFPCASGIRSVPKSLPGNDELSMPGRVEGCLPKEPTKLRDGQSPAPAPRFHAAHGCQVRGGLHYGGLPPPAWQVQARLTKYRKCF